MSEPAAVLDPTPGPPAETLLERAARIFAGDVRPDDYAPVPDEVREQIARAAADFKARNGYDLPPADRPFIANNLLAQYYGNGAAIVCRRTDRGLIVLAVGAEQVGPLLDSCRTWPDHIDFEIAPPW